MAPAAHAQRDHSVFISPVAGSIRAARALTGGPRQGLRPAGVDVQSDRSENAVSLFKPLAN